MRYIQAVVIMCESSTGVIQGITNGYDSVYLKSSRAGPSRDTTSNCVLPATSLLKSTAWGKTYQKTDGSCPRTARTARKFTSIDIADLRESDCIGALALADIARDAFRSTDRLHGSPGSIFVIFALGGDGWPWLATAAVIALVNRWSSSNEADSQGGCESGAKQYHFGLAEDQMFQCVTCIRDPLLNTCLLCTTAGRTPGNPPPLLPGTQIPSWKTP